MMTLRGFLTTLAAVLPAPAVLFRGGGVTRAARVTSSEYEAALKATYSSAGTLTRARLDFLTPTQIRSLYEAPYPHPTPPPAPPQEDRG